ncbi:hypothetical protein ACWGJX_34515 [Streptomyces sp. NPDC054775]
MTAPALYEIETSDGDDGTIHPAEQLWMPGAVPVIAMRHAAAAVTAAGITPNPDTGVPATWAA